MKSSNSTYRSQRFAWFAFSLIGIALLPSIATSQNVDNVAEYTWTRQVEEASWSKRAGLQAVHLNDRLYIMGGRTPRAPGEVPIPGDSDIWSDVWTSDDMGVTWENILATGGESHWPARAYFKAVVLSDYMYVLGGQNYNTIPNPIPGGNPPFLSVSDFFNDVWRSKDGVQWEQMTSDAGWAARAGLSVTVHNNELYVMGGSFNDDAAVIGGPPVRVYFNDVWKSSDGSNWEPVTAEAPWMARAGAVTVSKDGYIYLLGGEDGFTCDSGGDRCPPYFNDVWRSRDGANWEQVTAAADWSARPGHLCNVALNNIVCYGGFGLFANPMDLWVSEDGSAWTQTSASPWNAVSPDQVKYDFDGITVYGGPGNAFPSIFTFGGDRETFDFQDPENYLRVDNDVWKFAPPAGQVATNAASSTIPFLSPSQIFSVFSQIRLTTEEEVAVDLPLPMTLAGIGATLTDSEGASHEIGLFYAGPSQINGYLDERVATGNANLKIRTQVGDELEISVVVKVVAPGLFSADGSGTGLAAAAAVRVDSAGSQTPVPVLEIQGDALAAVPIDVAVEEQVVLLLFGSGIRNGSEVRVLINGKPATVIGSAPSSEYKGLDQINVKLDASLAGAGSVWIQVFVDGIPTNTVSVSIR